MKTSKVTRRQLLAATSLGTAAFAQTSNDLPALLGGTPVRSKPLPKWPNFREADERAVIPVLRSGVWSRAKVVAEAERQFAKLMGAPYCLATCNGTNAIITAVRALGIEAGDEVITTPYTFAATILPILLANALPVFADIDPVTWQIDPAKIEAKITRNTAAILPVHIIGGICDMDRINAIAAKHKLKVIEDACEAHGGEWKGRKVGTLGDLGCFSFQNGKALTCGEGGAVLGHDADLMDRCFSFHNMGRPKGKVASKNGQGHMIVATKCRMAEYQASILMTQMATFEEECARRTENSRYLTRLLKEIPGIVPREDYPQVTRPAFYYYGFRYKSEVFDGLPRKRFVEAMEAERVHTSIDLGVIEGRPMHREGCIEDALRSKVFQKVYGERLANYNAENQCPLADKLVEETLGFHQSALLGSKQDIEDIAKAVAKVYANRKKLALPV